MVVDLHGGRILEISRNGKVRWQFQGPRWPMDAVVCRNGNVFVAQQNNSQVSMWSRQGKELWTRQCNMPFACQQLRNGNLFVVCRQQVIEYDANGKEISSRQMAHLNWIVGGWKFPMAKSPCSRSRGSTSAWMRPARSSRPTKRRFRAARPRTPRSLGRSGGGLTQHRPRHRV